MLMLCSTREEQVHVVCTFSETTLCAHKSGGRGKYTHEYGAAKRSHVVHANY